MKPTPYLLALALATAPSAMSGESGSTVAKVTFRLTESITSPGLVDRDGDGKKIKASDRVYENQYKRDTPTTNVTISEYGSNISTSRLSNKQILEALVDAGAIPAISGWSIVLVGLAESNSKAEVSGNYFAATNSAQYINLSDYIEVSDGTGGAEYSRIKQVHTTTDESDTTKENGRRTGKQNLSFQFEFPDSNIMLYGVSNWSETLKTFGSGEETYTRWIPGPSRINSISGYRNSNSSDELQKSHNSVRYPSIIEGSISTSRAKLEVVSTNPDPS